MLKFPIIRVLCVIIFLTNNEILMVNTTNNNNNKEIFPVKINLPLINNNNNNLMRIKRGEIDLPTCIENFNVHRDKIIRTQDSQKMGAKYLTEMDLGSREECLRLCCETEECDVFVYEEKNSGSCYLFQCGPPEDFKCKFTHHVNYSSAILSISRHYFSADLENQIKLTKHIDELNRLSRKPAFSSPSDLNNNNNLKFIPTSSSSSSTIAPILINKEIIPSTSIIIDKTETSRTKCLRYQFECRSNSECIAIYNVCDGIPQCADGSDEANELGCPAPEAVASVTVQTTPSNILTVKSAKNLLEYGREGELVQQQQQQQQQSISNYQPILHASSSMQQEQDYPGNSRKVQFEQVAPNYWSQSRGIKLNQQIPQFQESAGFSAVNRIEKSNFQQYPEYPSRISNYYKNNNNNQPIPPLPQENWRLLSENDPFHQQQQQLLYNSKDSAPIIPAKSEGTDNMDNIEEFNSQNIINNKKPSVKQLDFSKELTNPPHIQDKLAHDLKQSKDKMTHGSVQKTKIIKIENLKSPQQESYKMIEDNNNIKDGHSVVPKGALLSLTLGLILTGIMAILIGCRLRGVKQRLLRKGGKGYAHDADYLVNGMYL